MTDDGYEVKAAAAGKPRTAMISNAGLHLVDRACPKCGYNLRGLPKDRPCPECGTWTDFSRPFNDELQYGNPEWARRLAWGMGLFLGGSVIFILQFVLLFGFGINAWAILALGLAGSVLECVGMWFFTGREPGPVEMESRWCVRRFLRWVAMAAIAADVGFRLNVVLLAMGVALAALTWASALTVLGISLVARAFLLGLYVGVLAKRIPDDPLANRAIMVSWGLAIFSPTLLLGVGAGMTLGGSWLSLVCAAVTMLPFLVTYVWGLLMLFGCVRDLRASAIEATKALMRREAKAATKT